MKASLHIAEILIGELLDLAVIDESMGAIGGYLIPNQNYEKYRPEIQQHCKLKGISNSSDFEYTLALKDGSVIVSEGGIGVTDIVEFDEIYVEAAGIDLLDLKL